MTYTTIIDILELLLLAGIFVFILRFVFLHYTAKVRKPAAWVRAVKKGEVDPELRMLERRYPDKIRFYNIWLQTGRIHRENIPGDFAELGVYKGETARVILQCARGRALHLFDTWEGFPPGDLAGETGRASTYTTQHFADASPGKVMKLLGDAPNVFVHEGYFPESASVMHETLFAFVSLDADLQAPTAAGLEFFYERLSPGGVILVHDYNTDWPGLMKAVDEFCKKHGVIALPLPDADSTVMIARTK